VDRAVDRRRRIDTEQTDTLWSTRWQIL